MYVYVYIYIYIYLSIYLSIYVSIYLSLYLSIYLPYSVQGFQLTASGSGQISDLGGCRLALLRPKLACKSARKTLASRV